MFLCTGFYCKNNLSQNDDFVVFVTQIFQYFFSNESIILWQTLDFLREINETFICFKRYRDTCNFILIIDDAGSTL